jgi:uncharacterized protein YbbK (DUF523 family)
MGAKHDLDRPRVGISSCLLGRRVRFDGGHKHDPTLTDELGRHVKWVPVCPEVEIGLPTPRDTMGLRARREGGSALVVHRTGADHTDAMRAYAHRRVRELLDLGLCGYVLKSRSPSCGLHAVPVFDEDGVLHPYGRGLFADELVRRARQMPVEEEIRLRDPSLRDSFVERVWAYKDVRDGRA